MRMNFIDRKHCSTTVDQRRRSEWDRESDDFEFGEMIKLAVHQCMHRSFEDVCFFVQLSMDNDKKQSERST